MPIRILDAAVVGRIAAGEVVERPSSVVKELMENAIDAGATAITVEMKGGGIDYLRVTDNGCGIEPNQVKLAFENHATSKLQTAEQLDDIRTLGFRGEALPSIASVSHVEMTTRARGQESGVRINIDGGGNLRAKEVGCPEGTTFIMKDLFYNLPVRRAFLKKPGYEGGLVSDVVSRMMMGNPGVSIRLISGGQTLCHSFGDGVLRHAVFAIYGKETAEQMVALDAAEGGMRIHGLIGVGELAKATRAHQAFFINGRTVRCAALTRALEAVCRTRVTIGMYPMCALHVTVPPASVHVNVHPNKLEVRFRDEEAMRQTAEQLMNRAFEGEKVLRLTPEDLAPPPPVTRVTQVRQMPTPAASPEPTPVEAPEKKETAVSGDFHAAMSAELEKYKDVSAEALQEPTAWAAPIPARPVPPPAPPKPRPVPAPKPVQVAMVETAPAAPEKPEYRVIGVLMKTYILVEAGDSLVMIDQHAAHERLNYERLMAAMEAGRGSQQLLTPLVLRLSAKEMALVKDNLEVLREAGYDVEPFGEQDIQVRSVPFILGKADLRPAFMDTVEALGRVKTAAAELRRAEILQMSCKSAVKGGDTLSDSEVSSLIRQMLETGAPPTCPHGRPVMKTLPRREIEKMFKRIQ